MTKKIMQHWFVVFVFFPYLVPLIFNTMSMEIQIICSLIILCLCLSYEWYRAEKRNNALRDPDKNTLSRLFSFFDINEFEEKISNTNAWYGYSQRSIRKVIEFTEQLNLPSNQIAKERVAKRLDQIRIALEDFIDFSSKKMYPEREYFVLPKDNEQQYRQSEVNAQIINEKSKKVIDLLLSFRKYMIEKDNVEIVITQSPLYV